MQRRQTGCLYLSLTPDPCAPLTPVIAIVGCPNVGKSTLFNRLTRSRAALVADEPGVTRDRQYGYADVRDCAVLLIDTGGIAGSPDDHDQLHASVSEQTAQALDEADAVLWVTDGRAGMTAGDLELAEVMRTLPKPVFLAVNKIDAVGPENASAEFHSIGGLGPPVPVSAKTGAGIDGLLDTILNAFPQRAALPEAKPDAIRVAIIGRPNVGKSTLLNRIAGEDRVLTSATPGTTRDSITVLHQRRHLDYLITDTAGIRRRSRVTDRIEKFSVIKSLKAIETCHIVILVTNAREAISDQDQTLLGMINQAGKALIIAVNKWDGLSQQQKSALRRQLDRKTGFIDYACIHYISALHGSGTGKLFDSIDRIARSWQRDFSASAITAMLHDALTANPPPRVRGRRIRLKYAHMGGYDPVRIIIHGNQTRDTPAHYRRYLAGYFRKKMELTGTPVFIEFRHGDNPYKGSRNTLNRRQLLKRRRMIAHSRKK